MTDTSTAKWTKRESLVADWAVWQVWASDRCVADFMTEVDADYVIALEETNTRLKAALEGLQHYGDRDVEEIARDALNPPMTASASEKG